MTVQAEIPWKLWVKHICPGCGLTGEGRYRLVVAGHHCPACGELLVQNGQPFPIEGSDALAG